MNELRAHPIRLLTIGVAGLLAFTTTYAVGSYGDAGPPAGASTPAAANSADPSEIPAVETPTPTPSDTAPSSTAPSGGSDGGGSTAPAQTTAQADEPEPTHQPAEHTTAAAPPDEPEPAPATSTYVATPDDQATHTCGASHDETCH